MFRNMFHKCYKMQYLQKNLKKTLFSSKKKVLSNNHPPLCSKLKTNPQKSDMRRIWIYGKYVLILESKSREISSFQHGWIKEIS